MPTVEYMAQPVGVAIPAFEVATGTSAKLITFSFTVRGGRQVLSNTIRIYENDGSTIPLFTRTVTSYVYEQSISTQDLYDNGLRNNNTYLVTFQTHGKDSENQNISSAESAPILFKTYQTPTLQFTNLITDTIQMANYTFDCKYQQLGGELLSSLYFYMYDNTHTLIATSRLYTSNDAIEVDPSPITGMTFQYEYQGFVDDSDYYIKAVATTINNTVVETEKHFFVDYVYENGYFTIKATNFANGGYVEVINNVSEIDGIMMDKNNNPVEPQYLGGNYIILDNDILYFDDGYQIASNEFVKQKWWFPVMLGETTKFYNENGQYVTVELKRGVIQDNGVSVTKDYIEVTQYDGINIKKKTSNLMSPLNQTVQVRTYVKINGDTITAEIALADVTSSAVWNGDSTISLDGMPTDMVWMGESGQSAIEDSYIDIDTQMSNIEWGRLTNMFWNDEPQAPTLIEYNDTTPMVSTLYTNTRLQNAIVNEFYVTKDMTQSMLSTFPEWDNATIMLADFNGNILAGNVAWISGSMNKIKLKRKLTNDTKNSWLTLWEKDINTAEDLAFVYRDYYVPSGDNYTYAMIPCVDNNEQEYFYTDVDTKFNALFISDKDQTMKLYSNYGISAAQDNMLIGVLQPYKSRFPITIKNPFVEYRTASFEGDVLGLNYNADEDNCIQTNFELTDTTRRDITIEVDTWSKFLCNGKTKIIRDWNGNIMMAQVTTPPSRSYDKTSGNSKPTMSFGVTEVGLYDSQSDLYRHGLINVEV